MPHLISCLDGEKFTGVPPGLPHSLWDFGQATDPSDGSWDGVSVPWLNGPADVLPDVLRSKAWIELKKPSWSPI